ncbi:MAG: hypothetical protein VW739_03925 [Pelagibacteraceae bacterium]
MSEFIKNLVNQYMINDKANNKYWSLQEITMKISEEYGQDAGNTAREYIIKDIMNIENEEEYINFNLKEVKRKKILESIYDNNKSLVNTIGDENV